MRKILARLGAFALLATALVALSPSAASAEVCPVAPQKVGTTSVGPMACPSAGVALAQLKDLGGGVVSVYGQTSGWSVGTIRVNATLYYDGAAAWSDQVTCYNAVSCSTTHVLYSTCFTGHWMLRVWGSKNNGAKVYAEDWEYVA